MTDDQRPRDVLAELEIWHSRPFTPTRRLALGNVMLPIDPAPGLGGLLLGGVVAAHMAEVDGTTEVIMLVRTGP